MVCRRHNFADLILQLGREQKRSDPNLVLSEEYVSKAYILTSLVDLVEASQLVVILFEDSSLLLLLDSRLDYLGI